MIKATLWRSKAYANLLTDPGKFFKLCWPDIRIYDRQLEIVYSVRDNHETYVIAGNRLGKDFISALITLWFFCSRTPCRIITSSATSNQLESVLWGEMDRFIKTSKYPLPIQVNHQHIRQRDRKGNLVPLSYIRGIVTNEPEALQGHHLPWGTDDYYGLNRRPHTLAIFDEASSISDICYEMTDSWIHRRLIIGNPLPCTTRFFRVWKEGSKLNPDSGNYYQKVIKMGAKDSPNVRLGMLQESRGLPVTNEVIIPGVIDYATYKLWDATWDKVRKQIGLNGEFYLGAEVLLYPPDWLDRANAIAAKLPAKRKGVAIGVDTAEGGDSTVWTVVDYQGLIYQESCKTIDTALITGRTIALMGEYGVPAEMVLFDRGGGGKQHSDRLHQQGYQVRTIGFGNSASPEKQKVIEWRGSKKIIDINETRYAYKNRRAEMYGRLRFELLDPILGKEFGIPAKYTELRRQLSPLPLLYDPEGRLYLPPKDKKNPDSKEKTLKEILGCSPDEADSFVLATFGLLEPVTKRVVGAF